MLLPLSQLQKHVAECCADAATDRYVTIADSHITPLLFVIVLLNITVKCKILIRESCSDGSIIASLLAS